MQTSRILVASVIAVGALPAGRLAAQTKVEKASWETLARAPFPEGTLPNVYMYRATAAPAPEVQAPVGAGHTHPGPVFVYILQGRIESQIEPDPPAIYAPGEFFYEAPGRVHRFLRNASKTETYMLLTFQSGHTERAGAPKPLHREDLPSTVNQEVSLLRLTLSPGAGADVSANANPDVIYVLEGKIETAEAKTYGPGEIFSKPAGLTGITIKNASVSEPAKLLLYQVSEKDKGKGKTK